jgi:hypothetical protein
VRPDGVRGEAGPVLQDGLAVGAVAARVVERLLQRAVPQVRAAHAPRAVFRIQSPQTIHGKKQFSERLPRNEPREEIHGGAAHLSGRRARRPPPPAGRGEPRPPWSTLLRLRGLQTAVTVSNLDRSTSTGWRPFPSATLYPRSDEGGLNATAGEQAPGRGFAVWLFTSHKQREGSGRVGSGWMSSVFTSTRSRAGAPGRTFYILTLFF